MLLLLIACPTTAPFATCDGNSVLAEDTAGDADNTAKQLAHGAILPVALIEFLVVLPFGPRVPAGAEASELAAPDTHLLSLRL